MLTETDSKILPVDTGEQPVEPPGLTRDPWVARHTVLAVFLASFVALSAVLFFENRQLFRTPIHEEGDSAANSIIIQDAKELQLLVGNYSRQLFHHPGPADFYAQAAGEVLFHDVLSVVPAPYNGQNLAILILNAALVAVVLALLYDITRSVAAAIVAGGIVLVFCASHTLILAATWMPYVYFAPFLVLLVAAASVATGRTRHLWALGLAGGLLVHGHAEFLFFVPLIAVPAMVFCLRSRPGRWASRLRHDKRDWVIFLSVVMIFVFPIALNTLLHWPGEFGDYIRYSRSSKAGGHSLGDATRYVGSFWSSGAESGYTLPVALVSAALALAIAQPNPATRRFLEAILASVALATGLFLFYTLRGVDDLSQQYIGFFYWAAPAAVLIVVAAGVVSIVVRSRAHAILASVMGAIAVLLSMHGTGLVNTYAGYPSLPEQVGAIANTRSDPHTPLVLEISEGSWADALAVIVQADRTGVRACTRDADWELIVTSEFVCSARDLADGTVIRFWDSGSTPTGSFVAAMPYSTVTVDD